MIPWHGKTIWNQQQQHLSWEPSVGPSESGAGPGSSNSPSDEHRSQSSNACHKTGNRKRKIKFQKGTDLNLPMAWFHLWNSKRIF